LNQRHGTLKRGFRVAKHKKKQQRKEERKRERREKHKTQRSQSPSEGFYGGGRKKRTTKTTSKLAAAAEPEEHTKGKRTYGLKARPSGKEEQADWGGKQNHGTSKRAGTGWMENVRQGKSRRSRRNVGGEQRARLNRKGIQKPREYRVHP